MAGYDEWREIQAKARAEGRLMRGSNKHYAG
jgi:hypothetical protein